MKKTVTLIMTIVMLITLFAFNVSSQENVLVYINGEKIEFDVQPQIINGRTMVPMRKIFEELGAVVGWFGDSQEIWAYRGKQTIWMFVGNEMLYVNGIQKTLDVPPCLVDERTLVPVRAISESFGANVYWDAKNKAVYISIEDLSISCATCDGNGTYGTNSACKNLLEDVVNSAKALKLAIEDAISSDIVLETYNSHIDASFEFAGHRVHDCTDRSIKCADCDGKGEIEPLYKENTQKVYTDDGWIIIKESDVDKYVNNGWYTEQRVTMYSPDGKTIVVFSSETIDYINDGWYINPVVKMYSAQGETIVVSKTDVEKFKVNGWYTEPKVTMYSVDGESKEVSLDKIETYKTLGWYDEPVQTLYAPGKSAVFKKSEVSAQLAVGWYTEPVCTMYAPDGRTINISESEVEAYKKVGWYTNQKDAIASKYPKHNIRILYIDADCNSVGGIEPTIVWRNDSGKTIKYIYFTCVPYNAVGDIVSCDITRKTYANLQSTGPYKTFTNADLEQPWPRPCIYFKRWAEPIGGSNGEYSVFAYDASIGQYTRFPLMQEDYKHVYNFENSWDPIWYNYSIDYIKITKVNVIYMDGTSETISNPPIWREVFRNAGI